MSAPRGRRCGGWRAGRHRRHRAISDSRLSKRQYRVNLSRHVGKGNR
ncbi:hypothetical protein HMPREF0262_00822 [Clostridium sp. ATCC 29733]|nr:hypothetical protein HMPREF0262_00822 [Clostridium sp. ATCC 29733]